MRVELFPFQKRALADIRMKTAEAMGSYHRTHAPQVVSPLLLQPEPERPSLCPR